ncbi:AlpA family transcriptional regulator [Pelagibius sp.]|uniref:AlpA family transcriptional regulator n=1 Tax=Pelagibius sp. TaxID=1931238 RepID=UPI003B505959
MEANPLSHDLLSGAEEIAAFTGLPVRRVYYIASQKGVLPIFRLGNTLCARKSELAEALSAKRVQSDG